MVTDGGGILDTENLKNIADILPQRQHSVDPTVAFPVNDGLCDVDTCCEGEQDGEDISSGGVGTKAP